MFSSRIFPALMIVSALFAGASNARAEGVVTIEDFESGLGSWTSSASGISVGLNLITLGAIEGSNSLGQTLGVGALFSTYNVYNSNLDVQVPPGIETLKFKYRVLAGLNIGKSFKVTLTDQDGATYVSDSVPMSTLSINVTKDFALPLADFTPAADGGVIERIKGVSINYTNGITVGANEQLDSIRMTWDDSGVSYATHTMGIDFGTRVNGPNTTFTLDISLSPADVDISKYSVRVGYDNTQVSYDGVLNNTGQPGSVVTYNVGPEMTLTGYPHVNTYRTISLDALPALVTPTLLGELHFTATPAFNDPDNRAWIILLPNDPVPTLRDPNWNPIPVVFNDPNVPVPVSISSFTLE